MTTHRYRTAVLTPQKIIWYFYAEEGFSDKEIALLVTAHAGHHVAKRTIVGMRTGEPGYTGRNLAPALLALAPVWGIVSS